MSFVIVSISVITSGWIMIYSFSAGLEKEFGERTMAIARTVAQMPDIKNHVGKRNGEAVIQPIAERTRLATNVNYIVVFDMNLIRYSSPSEELIGKRFEGGDEGASLAELEYVSKAVGVLGPSIRAFVPIMDEEGLQQVGVVVVGVLLPTFQSLIDNYRQQLFISILWGLFIGLAGSLYLAHHIKKQTLSLEPYQITKLVQERNAVMQAMDIGIITIDENGKITFMNRLAKEYTRLENFHQDKHPLYLSDAFPTIWRTIFSLLKEGNEQNIHRNIKLFNNTYLISLHNLYVKKRLVGSFITLTDKTEANRLAEELTGVKTLVDALRAQNHEYMNKLHSIAGLIQLNRNEEALQIIIDETTEEEDVIQFLKDNIHEHSVSGLLLGKKSRAKELNIHFFVDRNSYLTGLIDGFSSGDLVTILGNLIENAFEASQSGELEKQVYCLIQGDEKELRIIVKDDGKGIPKELKEQIFQYGFSTKKNEGRGIGLALVKHIVDSHGGTIELHSEENNGTEILVEVKRGDEE